jgi:hypothetical protein
MGFMEFYGGWQDMPCFSFASIRCLLSSDMCHDACFKASFEEEHNRSLVGCAV